MSRIIIAIHGMGNKPDQKQLKKWWKEAIREGLEGKGHFFFLRFKLVYWASILNKKPLDFNCSDSKSPFFLHEPYTRGSGNPISVSNSIFKKRIRDQINEQFDRIFLEKNGTLNFSMLSDFIIHHFVRDVDAYYNEGLENPGSIPVRQLICQNLADTLYKNRKNKILLIAHSMGSIITWDVLTKYVPEVKIHTLVTIGSPLGIPFVKSQMLLENKTGKNEIPYLKTPENIQHSWFNLSDFKDRVAINYDLKTDFRPNSRAIQPQDILVYNNYKFQGEANHHKSYGYLRCPEMGDIISDFLKNR